MTIGDRTITGLIKRREEAKRIYEAARDAGQAASLLDQERPNIFTQSVANILPGSPVRITISYVELLEYEDGEYEFSFPMVVGPRYIPGQLISDLGGTPKPLVVGTTQVPDAGRITPPVTPEGTRAGHDIALSVSLDAGVAVQKIDSELHEVDVERPSETQAVVRLKNLKEIPNRDFVLRYKVAGKAIEDAILTHSGARGGFFTLILQPPARVAPEAVTPKEMIFVIDCSGSMSGFPIEKAKRTMKLCIEQMNPHDTFNLVSFAGGTGYCFQRPVANTPENRRKALEYLSGLQGGGGTEMMGAIRAALEGQDDRERLRVVCFMTDGFIGNDMEILDAIQKNAKTARVFAFGIGNGVNRFLIEGMARAGRGAAEVVTLESDGDAAAVRFHERVHSPILTNIAVNFGGLAVADVFPALDAIPDLFSARPLILKGRYTAGGDYTITVRGETAAGPFERAIPVTFPRDAPGHDVLAPLWARAGIESLMEQDWLGIQKGNPDTSIREGITKLGLDYNLVTQFTSFVAVEERKITEGGNTKTVQVPVEMTDGVSYEGVFGSPQLPASPMPLASVPVAGGQWMAKGIVGAMPTVRTMELRGEAASTQEVRTEYFRQVPQAESDVVRRKPAKTTKDPKLSSKLDPMLANLKSKLVSGNYSAGPVKVVNGWVTVFIRLAEDKPEHLEALKKLGVAITSHAASSKMVVAKVKVEDLETVAEQPFVARIEPPAY